MTGAENQSCERSDKPKNWCADISHVRPIRNSNLEIFSCENKGHVASSHSGHLMFCCLRSGSEQRCVLFEDLIQQDTVQEDKVWCCA